MILAAAKGLANSLNDQERAQGDLYPSLKRIRDVSANVAAHVCKVAEQENQLQNKSLSGLSIEQLTNVMRKKMWEPETAQKLVENPSKLQHHANRDQVYPFLASIPIRLPVTEFISTSIKAYIY